MGEKIQRYSGRVRKYPAYELSRSDMFHVLRHTYASVQLEADESIVSLSRWLGHSSPRIALDHYAHIMPGAGSRGLAAMDAWLEQDRHAKSLRSPCSQDEPHEAVASGSGMRRRVSARPASVAS